MKESYNKLFPTDKNRTFFPSFVKIIIFCWISAQHSVRFVWFDSGCIDKNSSAELEESIRSMFNWYSKSKVCIVHLADTTNVSSFRRDQWFTRGWTLQELLAPKQIMFFGKSWRPVISSSFGENDKDLAVGSFGKKNFWDHISDITGISQDQICTFKSGIENSRNALVWLSKRQTTRIEDMAYCLIALLGVPLTIAYGEQDLAFYRLQAEILQRTLDMGLFIWEGQSSVGNSMLAAKPDSFSLIPFRPFPSTLTGDVNQSYSFTNFGLRIPLLIYRVPDHECSLNNQNSEMELKIKNNHPITVKLQTREAQDSVELAFLGDVDWGNKKSDIAILLGYKDAKYKRISSNHVYLPRPRNTTLETIFIR